MSAEGENNEAPNGEGADAASKNSSRLLELTLDETSIGRNTPDVEHERDAAIFDLLENNFFELEGRQPGPYTLHLSITDNRLVFAVGDAVKEPVMNFLLSLSPFRRLVKDYFIIVESYHEAIKRAPPSRIKAIDMGRRGLHDEGSQLLMERLSGKITVDFDTARRLFTLICALHWKG